MDYLQMVFQTSESEKIGEGLQTSYHVEVSLQRGTPFIIHVFFGCSMINHPTTGISPCMETPI